MKKRLATLRESAAAIAAHLSTAQLARLVPLLEMLLQARTGAPPLVTSTRSYSQNPAAIRQRRSRGLGEFAGEPRHAVHAAGHAHSQRTNGAGSVNNVTPHVTPRPSSSSFPRSASAASALQEQKPKQRREKQPSAAKRKGGGELHTLMQIWGKSAMKHRVSSKFGGDPKELFAVKAACAGDVAKYTARVDLYHRECALARRTPSVDELAENLEKIQRAMSPRARNSTPKNGARNGALAGTLPVSSREAFLRGAVRRGEA